MSRRIWSRVWLETGVMWVKGFGCWEGGRGAKAGDVFEADLKTCLTCWVKERLPSKMTPRSGQWGEVGRVELSVGRWKSGPVKSTFDLLELSSRTLECVQCLILGFLYLMF